MAQQRSIDRRERILDAALDAFAGRGYHDTQVDEIARTSETSKGGVYFHFPTKEAIFLALMSRTADKLIERAERAVATEEDPIAQADAALRVTLQAFAGHRAMARLFFVEALGAGPAFHAELGRLHERFASLIRRHLDEAVVAGQIAPIDTDLASQAWFGALNEIVARWLLDQRPGRLEEAYPTLRTMLLRSVGIGDEEVARRGAPRPPLGSVSR